MEHIPVPAGVSSGFSKSKHPLGPGSLRSRPGGQTGGPEQPIWRMGITEALFRGQRGLQEPSRILEDRPLRRWWCGNRRRSTANFRQ